eukprot:6571567-Alexandrium_andersonii.AAC.1
MRRAPLVEVAWSFEHLLSGLHPALDPDGNEWLCPKRRAAAGQPLAAHAGGLPRRAAYVGLRGDEEWLLSLIHI